MLSIFIMNKLFVFICLVISTSGITQECFGPSVVFSLVENTVLSTYHDGYRYIVINNEDNVLTLEKLSTTEENLPHTSSEFITEVPFNNPISMTFSGDDLYIINLDTDTYKLYKIDFNTTSPTVSLVLDTIGNYTGIFSRMRMRSNGSKLYFSHYTTSENGYPGNLYTFDTENPDAGVSLLFEFTDNVLGLNLIFSPIILNDTYYFTDIVEGKIYQVDLNAPNPEPVLFNSNPGHYGYYLGGTGDFLYTTNGTHPNATLSIFNISSPIAERIYSDVYCNDTVSSFFIFEDYFYYSSWRRPLEDFVIDTIQENNTSGEFNIFPNPSSEILFIQNLETPSSFELIDLTGKIVLSGFIDTNEITISSLPTGMYFLKLGNQKKYLRIFKR